MQDYEPQFQLRKVELKINSNNKLLLNGENENYDIIQRMEFRNNFCFILTKTYDVFLIGNFSNTQSYILKHWGLMPETFKCAKSKFLIIKISVGKISDITCNNSWVLLLSKDGMVYSWGKDINKWGVLGIGKGINEELNPSPIMSLIDYRIININIDETKAWAISNDGKLFIWGMFNTSQYINNPKFTINENLISNDIIIPTPLFVDILQPYFITKATPFSNLKDESLRDIGTNIWFKYYDNNQMFGLILGYNPRINSGKQEAFLSSVSFLEQPWSPIDPYGRRFSK